MTPFGHLAGYAGAFYGFMQLSGGALVAALVAYLPEDNPLPLAAIFVVCAGVCLGIQRWIITKSAA